MVKICILLFFAVAFLCICYLIEQKKEGSGKASSKKGSGPIPSYSSSNKGSTPTWGPASSGSRLVQCCPHCGKEIAYGRFLPGSPIQICERCGTEYIDLDFVEVALFPEREKGLLRWEPEKLAVEQEASEERLSEPGYAARLLEIEYEKKYPYAEKRLRELVKQSVKTYVNAFSNRLNVHYPEFRIRDFDTSFDQLTYEARNAEAVKNMVKEILTHYELTPNLYQVQVAYADRKPEQGQARGHFSPRSVGGIVEIVIEPSYSEYDTVVAIGLHECAHAFLHRHNIQLPDTKENERLTDTTAILLGGGKYIIRGYFPSSRCKLGYLSKAECEAVQEERVQLYKEWSKQRDAELRWRRNEQQRVSSRLSELVTELHTMTAEFHPNRIVRELSIVNELNEQWQIWQPKLVEAESLVAILNSTENDVADSKYLEKAKTMERHLGAFSVLLREWRDVERYQAEQFHKPNCSLQMLREKATQDNPFLMLDMMRFWDAHPATHRDAEIFFKTLLTRNEKDSQYVLGICCKEGVVVPVDLKNARFFFTQASALGSEDAERMLQELSIPYKLS